jgi:cholesterol transport system auxiliary component
MLAAPVLAAALAGCSTLLGGGGKAPDVYDLTAPVDFKGLRGRTGAQLLVPVPTALEALATGRVVVRQDGSQLSYYPGISWSDDLPALVQTKLIRAFENSGRAKAVGRPGESLAIDYQVIVDIRAFELDSAGRTAHVELGVKLLDDRTGKVRATKIVDARVPAGSDAATAVVQAIDAAAGKALTEVVTWTAATI